MSDTQDVVERLREAQSAVDSFRGDLGSAAFEDACRTARHRAFIAAPVLLAEITRLRAALAANRQDWDRVHHALAKHGKHPGRTDDHLADVIDRALAAAPGASPPAALAVPAGMVLVLVPVEPTPEMVAAVARAGGGTHHPARAPKASATVEGPTSV